jgi:carbamate kinase
VPVVFADYGTPQAHAISRTTPELLRHMAFPSGSMGPKVEAACHFVAATGGNAAIGALSDAEALAGQRTGTVIARCVRADHSA